MAARGTENNFLITFNLAKRVQYPEEGERIVQFFTGRYGTVMTIMMVMMLIINALIGNLIIDSKKHRFFNFQVAMFSLGLHEKIIVGSLVKEQKQHFLLLIIVTLLQLSVNQMYLNL